MTTYEYFIDKYKIEVGNQYIVNVPNMGRDDLAGDFGALGFKLGVEVGVARGDYSVVLCGKNPKLHLFGVDPWLLTAYEPEINPADAGNLESQPQFDDLYEACKNKVAPFNVTLLKKFSADALSDFTNNSLDFVYIDANHDFPNFIFDLHYWMKKVKIGGVVSGHDYALFSYRKHNHVKRALDAYARSYRMNPLFIAGSEEVRPGEIRDRFRSWFWIKSH